MKLNKFLGFVLALSVVGCTNDLMDEGIATNNDAVLSNGADTELVISAGLAEEETKATIAYGNQSYVMSARFEQADAIGTYLYHEDLEFSHLNLKFEAVDAPYDADGDGINDKIDFKAMEQSILLQPGVQVYAYYPYKNGNTIIGGDLNGEATKATQRGGWNGTREFVFDKDQSIEGENLFGKIDSNIVLTSAPAYISMGEGNSYKADMKFRFANSFVTLHIKNEFTRDMTVKSVKVQLTSGGELLPITGTFTYDFDKAGAADKVNPFTPVTGKTFTEVSANLDNMIVVPQNNADRVCIPMVIAPVDNVDGAVIDIYTEDGAEDYFFRITKDWSAQTPSITRGANFPVSVNLTKETRYDDDFVHIYDFDSLKKYMQEGANENALVMIDADIDGAGKGVIETNIDGYSLFNAHTVVGNGHTLSNITVEGKKNAGFIGAGRAITMSDLTFENWDVTAAGEGDKAFAGTVFGTIWAGDLNNVKVIDGKVKGLNKVGGLIGYAADGSTLNIAKTSVAGTIVAHGDYTGVAVEEFGSVGGLIGFTQSRITIDAETYVEDITIDAQMGRNDRHNGFFIGTFNTGSIEIETENAIRGSVGMHENFGYTPTAYDMTSPYWVEGFEGDKALVGGHRGTTGTVTINGYVFEGTKPAVKDGKYHIFNAHNYVDLAANVATTGLDKDVILKNNIDFKKYDALQQIYLKSHDAGENNTDWYTFEGNGKALENLSVLPNAKGYYSLFNAEDKASGNLKVSNLVVTGANFGAIEGVNGATVADGTYAAIFVAKPAGDVVMDKVIVKNSTISGSHKVGLLVGYAQSTCGLKATNIEFYGNNVYATQGQVGIAMGYACDGVELDIVKSEGNHVYSGFAKAGRTFGKYVGTIGDGKNEGVSIVLNAPAEGVVMKAYNGEFQAQFDSYYNTMLDNSFEYMIGGWDNITTISEEDDAIINGSKLFHATAYNVWDAASLKAREGQRNGRNIYVVRDVDYNGDFSTMVMNNYFFDGQDCTIKGLNYTKATAGSDDKWLGLFTYQAGKGVTVKNVTLDGVTVADGANYAAAVLAYADWGNTLVENVVVRNADIKAGKVGGIAGYYAGNYIHAIKNCLVENSTFTVTESNPVAGVVAHLNAAANVQITDTKVNNITVNGYTDEGDQTKKVPAYFVGRLSGNANLLIENGLIDDMTAIDAAKPWKLDITKSTINGDATETCKAYVADYAYQSYGKLLGGWDSNLGTVKMNGIDYNWNYKGVYSVGMNNVWYGAIKHALENNTEADATIGLYEGRVYREPDTDIEGVNLTIKEMDGGHATISGHLHVYDESVLTVNGLNFDNEWAGELTPATNRYHNIILENNASLVASNCEFKLVKDGASIFTKASGNDIDANHAGVQAVAVNLNNNKFTGNAETDVLVDFEGHVYGNFFQNTFNTFKEYAIYVGEEGENILFLDENSFNGAGKIVGLEKLWDASCNMNIVFLGEGNGVDNNKLNGAAASGSSYKALNGATEGMDFVVAERVDATGAVVRPF